jgi:hypothetical protein
MLASWVEKTFGVSENPKGLGGLGEGGGEFFEVAGFEVEGGPSVAAIAEEDCAYKAVAVGGVPGFASGLEAENLVDVL